MNDIEKKIEALKTEFLGKLEDLQNEVEMQREQEEPKPWNPEIGESYFFIRNDFEVTDKVKGTTSFEADRISNGNCFPTRERAEEVAEKMRLLLRMEQLHDQLCPDYVPDWRDDETKLCVYFNHEQSNWGISCSTVCESPCLVAFDSYENACKAAEILTKEIGEPK
mgnify:CR=1 FL=1